jgi:hypothetical protein
MKYKKIAIWSATNAAYAWLVWAAVEGNTGAGNLLVAISWFLAVTMTVCSVWNSEIKWSQDYARSVHPSVSTPFEMLVAAFLVWNGWWLTGLAVVLAWVGAESVYRFMEEKQEEGAK